MKKYTRFENKRLNSFFFFFSSSKDQLTGINVAIKKIMKPFSAPVLAKRTYRELKLLKALRHENVRYKQKKGLIC
jgi:serine/threonine protein kinase